MSAPHDVLALVERAPDPLLAVSAGGEVLFASPSLEPEFGLAPAAVENRALADLVHPADRQGLADLVRVATAGPDDQPDRTAVVRLRSGAGWRAAEARLGPAELGGGRVAVVSLAPLPGGDGTGAAPAAVGAGLTVDPDTGEVTIGGDVAEALGRPPGERSTVGELVHPDDVPVVRALVGQDGHPRERQFGARLLGADGRWRAVTVARRATAGQPGATLAVQFEHIPPVAAPAGTVDALPVGVLVVDADLAAVSVNRRTSALLRLPAAASGRAWLDAVVPGDRPRLEAALQAALATGGDVAARAALVGDRGVIELRGAPISCRPGLLACVVDEVGQAVRAEEEAVRLGSIVEASSDLIATTDSDGRLRWVNPAFRLFLSAITDDPSELRLADVYAPWARERWEEEALVRLEQRGLWTGEMALRPIGTAEVPVSQVSVAHRDARGDVDFCSHVLRDLTSRKVHEAGLAHQATHDPLTDLPNRVLLMDRLHTALARSRRNGGIVAVLFCDLDDFKDVNDTFGHAAGDGLLLAVADRLSAVLREPDTVARLGGDEFVMLCEGLRSPEEADAIAARVTAALSEPVDVGGVVVAPNASVGVAVTVEGDVDGETLIRRADRAMYRVKHAKSR